MGSVGLVKNLNVLEQWTIIRTLYWMWKASYEKNVWHAEILYVLDSDFPSVV